MPFFFPWKSTGHLRHSCHVSQPEGRAGRVKRRFLGLRRGTAWVRTAPRAANQTNISRAKEGQIEVPEVPEVFLPPSQSAKRKFGFACDNLAHPKCRKSSWHLYGGRLAGWGHV
ncbi:unnamed protein product [Effrenium voratum]|nr:unnamed protein product [Effrenium voratum]